GEVAASGGGLLLLIDELHIIVGTGAGGGGMDVSNMLKPMLARGELRLIGASTPDEYRKNVEKDAALERRSQPIYVEPPSAQDTIEILRGLQERHEIHHGVRIHDSAIEAAVMLSDRYVSGRNLPDKAIDLIDEAASRLRIGIESPPADLAAATRRMRQLEIEMIGLRTRGDETGPQRRQLEQELTGLRSRAAAMTARWQSEQNAIAAITQIKAELALKKAAVARFEREDDLAGAADIHYQQIAELELRLNAAAKALGDLQGGQRLLKDEVD